MSEKQNGKELLNKIVLGVASTALMLLIGLFGYIGNRGLNEVREVKSELKLVHDLLMHKITLVSDGMQDNRLRIAMLETERKIFQDEALKNQHALIMEMRRISERLQK